jgi:uncharacterized protein
MPDEVLEAFVRQYIESQDLPEVVFSWQGGEPTLLGLNFFSKVVELQKQYANGKKVDNAFQTNGMLLDDWWCEFLTEHGFLVGLSIDGPGKLHNRYRVDKRGKPTFEAVMHGLELLRKHKTRFNTLTVVNDTNSRHPLEVYHFLKEVGDGFMQFIPLVERVPEREARDLGLKFGTPPGPVKHDGVSKVTAWSVKPENYAKFTLRIFDEWVRQDVGKVFVQFFDVSLGNWMGVGSGLCQFAPECGFAGAMEHNGDLYACDHYVYPQYRLGNILDTPLAELMESERQRKFGKAKSDTLQAYCMNCDYQFACNGDCPKHRFGQTPEGKPGLSYLCPAYKRIFQHIDPFMRFMANMARAGHAPALIMGHLSQEERLNEGRKVKRNDPCLCGSGKKYKKCCGF